MKKLILLSLFTLSLKAQSFDLPFVFDVVTPITNDVSTTNVTSFANVNFVKLFKGNTWGGTFTLQNVYVYNTNNSITISNLPMGNITSYFYITLVGPSGETIPSNTNKVFHKTVTPIPSNLKGAP